MIAVRFRDVGVAIARATKRSEIRMPRILLMNGMLFRWQIEISIDWDLRISVSLGNYGNFDLSDSWSASILYINL